MKVAIYARVSTAEQTTETQLLPLRDYCQRNCYEIYEQYIDDGFSGKDDKRPAFERMLNDMRGKKFECIVVWKIDRVGRSLQHLLNFLAELRKRNVHFVSTTEQIDTSTPHGELIWNIMGAFAQFERSIIVSRTKAGLERAKKEGKTLGRPKGSKDLKLRRVSGYYMRWMKRGK